MDRTLAKHAPDILFVKIESDGFDLGAQRRPNGRSDLPMALSALLKFRRSLHEGKGCEFSEEERRLAHRVARGRIAEGGDYNLSGERYKETIKSKRSEYELFEINDICEVVRGSSPRPKADPKYYGGTVPRLMISDVTRDGMYVTPLTDFLTSEGAKLSRPMKKGEVVVAVSGNPGIPAILKVDACIHDGFVGFRNLNPKILPEFFYYFLFHQKERSNSQSVGAIFKNLTTDQIKKIKIPLPPLSVQQEIVAEIESYQKIIDGARQVVENYKPKIKVDEGWEVVELGKMCTELKSGFACGDSDKNSDGIPHLRPMNISSEGRLVWNGTKYISEEYFKDKAEYTLKKGDVLFNNTNSKELVGKTCFVKEDIDCGYSNHMTRIRTEKSKLDGQFLSLILHSIFEKGIFLEKCNKWVGQAGINNRLLFEIKIPLPPLDVQKEIVVRIEEEQKLVDANKKLIGLFEGKIKEKIAEVWG